jgi:hypothetical protein
MGQRFAELAFTPAVKALQKQHGSRHLYERVEQSGDLGDRLGADEQAFVESRDGFYLASTTESGWPYIQFRGGPRGFIRVLDERTLGFADLRGNKQYISVGNLKNNDRVALFLMDYPSQSRLKILGHAKVHEGDAEAQAWIERLKVSGEKTPVERALIIHIEAFDWNCPQHITPRYSEAELAKILEPMRTRLASLEAENKRLRAVAG